MTDSDPFAMTAKAPATKRGVLSVLQALKPFRIPLILIVACILAWVVLQPSRAHGATLQKNESISAMLGKLSPAQQQIADRARELFDVVTYGPGGPISGETPELGPIVQSIARTCLLNALQKLHDGAVEDPARLAFDTKSCQEIELKRNIITRTPEIYVLAFGPSS